MLKTVKKGINAPQGLPKEMANPFDCIIIDLGGAKKLVNLENWLQ